VTAITVLDESYTHQLVAPAAETLHVDPAWGERCYHLLHLDGPLVLNAGRAVYPHRRRRTGFAGLTTGRVQHALRLGEDLAPGAHPDRPTVGPLRIEAVRPLEEVRLVLDAPGHPVAFDLTFRARFPPVASERNRIELDGRVVTDYMNFFQSGLYSGLVRVDGEEHRVTDRAGFRDRGWGLRKHEGAPRRGLVLVLCAELPDQALYAMLYETASGRRVLTNGWLLDRSGVADTLTEAEHDLAWDGTRLTSGRVALRFASGAERTLELTVLGRLFLEAVGYTADPERARPGSERHDVTRPEVLAALFGQTDHGCAFRLDGVQGHGYVETGLGIHARYRPEPGA
jgi:hypothetical protein